MNSHSKNNFFPLHCYVNFVRFLWSIFREVIKPLYYMEYLFYCFRWICNFTSRISCVSNEHFPTLKRVQHNFEHTRHIHSWKTSVICTHNRIYLWTQYMRARFHTIWTLSSLWNIITGCIFRRISLDCCSTFSSCVCILISCCVFNTFVYCARTQTFYCIIFTPLEYYEYPR